MIQSGFGHMYLLRWIPNLVDLLKKGFARSTD